MSPCSVAGKSARRIGPAPWRRGGQARARWRTRSSQVFPNRNAPARSVAFDCARRLAPGRIPSTRDARTPPTPARGMFRPLARAHALPSEQRCDKQGTFDGHAAMVGPCIRARWHQPQTMISPRSSTSMVRAWPPTSSTCPTRCAWTTRTCPNSPKRCRPTRAAPSRRRPARHGRQQPCAGHCPRASTLTDTVGRGSRAA